MKNTQLSDGSEPINKSDEVDEEFEAIHRSLEDVKNPREKRRMYGPPLDEIELILVRLIADADSLSKPDPDLINEARKALDQAYQEKFLERLPKGAEYRPSEADKDHYYKVGYNTALNDIKAAFKNGEG